MASRFWQIHGNSQENETFSYTELYKTNTAAGAIDLLYYLIGGFGIKSWMADQPTIISTLRSTGTNIVSARIGTLVNVAQFATDWGSSHDTWEAAVKSWCLAYMAQNCFFCAITNISGTVQVNNDIQKECDRRMRLWGNQYYHALVDLDVGGIGTATFPLTPAYDDGTGHLTLAGQTVVESVTRPQLDALPSKRRVVKIGS